MTPRPVRVVEIVTKLDIGGAPETVVALAESIDPTDVALTVVAGAIDDGSAGPLRADLERRGIRVTSISSLRRNVSLLDIAALIALVRLLRREQPDVVHTHTSKAGVLGRVAARLAGVPAVVHTAHAWSFDARGNWVLRRVCVAAERVLARLTDVIVVVAHSNQRAGERLGIKPRTGYRVIRSAIDLSVFRPANAARRRAARAELGLTDDDVVVGSVTRLQAPKDPETFVRAIGRLRCIGVIVGDGPLRATVEQLAIELDVGDRVRVVGERRDVADVLPAFDVFALASRWEGLPRAPIEAMATGIPVVVSDVNGVSELVSSEVNGKLVPPGRPDAMADAIAAILDEPALAQELAAKALHTVGDFDVATMAAAHVELYRALAPQRGPLRVVHVITGLDSAGAENMLAGVVARIDPALVESHVISLTDLGPVAERIAGAGIGVEALGMTRGRADIRAVWRLARRLRELHPDVVQTWLYHADLVGGFAARLARVPVVAWNLQISSPDAFLRPRTRLTARVAGSMSRALPTDIVVCAESAVEPHVALGYDRHRMRVIRNGFDVDRFVPDSDARADVRRELGLVESELMVTVAARFDPQKDYGTFVAAAGRVAAQFPTARFVLCGSGVTASNAQLTRWCAHAAILDRVALLGPRADVARILAASDIVVSSSVMEGFSLTIGEAMACGVPAVVTDVGDNAHLVGDAGRVVPTRDAAALAAAVGEVLALPRATRVELGAAAAERVRANFSLGQAVARYEDLYLSAWAREGAKSA